MKNLSLTLIIVALGLSSAAFGFQIDYVQQSLSFPKGDSTVRIHLYADSKLVKPNPDRCYTWYHDYKLNTTVGAFQYKLVDGGYSLVSPEGNLLEKGQFDKGTKTGTWTTWYKNGKRKKTETWRGGFRNGPFSQYLPNGDLERKGNYKQELLDGKLHIYVLKDSVLTEKYRDGVLLVRAEKEKELKQDKATSKEDNKAKKKERSRKEDKNSKLKTEKLSRAERKKAKEVRKAKRLLEREANQKKKAAEKAKIEQETAKSIVK